MVASVRHQLVFAQFALAGLPSGTHGEYTGLPEFLSYQTNSLYGRRYFLKCAKKTSNLASINSTQVKAFPVLLPDRDEQERVLGLVKPMDDQSAAVAAHVTRCNEIVRGFEAALFEETQHG